MSSGAADAVVVARGFQLLSSYRFNHQIRCVAPQGTDSVAAHYTAGSEHITSVCPVKPHGFQRKYTVEETVLQLLFIKKYRLHVAFCSDLTLRVYSEHFRLIQVVHITATVLSMLFIEETATLYTGEVGCLEAWYLRPHLHSPLVRQKRLHIAVKQEQWVGSLDCDVCGQMVAVACQDAVFIIDAQTHQQRDVHLNRHVTSITSALLCSQLDYLITSSKDGSIIIQSTILHCEVHTFTGHVKAVTALKHHSVAHCILSCSLDGTVRVWDLHSLSECYRLDCGKELLGMSYDFRTGSQLVCHSRKTVTVWVGSQLESHFATVNSHVLALNRVEALGSSKPARILAKADDGGVRLLCPVSGEVITILLPLSCNVADDIVYCPIGCLLFTLLRTSEVLVLSAHTNPCSVVELWTSGSKDRYESICLCLVEWRGKVHSLLFGGQESGYIALLYSPLFTMPHPCPAHAGSVCKLASQASPAISSENTPCLVSFGSDSFFNIWTVAIRENNHHILLKILLCVQLESPPRHIGILGTLACLTTIQNTVKMLDISTNLTPLETHYLGHGCLLDSMAVLSHQREDSHTGPITSLSCCPSLGLFATSSRDGHVKVWNTSNQLVSDAHFGDTLTSVCFSNVRGDMLVGFQRQICLVQAHDYLPLPYLELSKKYPLSEQTEEPLPFDLSLKFWYSPDRVPSLPLHLEEGKEQSCLNEFYIESPRTDHNSEEDQLSVVASGGVAPSFYDVIDPHLTKRCSHHYYASLVQSASTSSEETIESSIDRDPPTIEPVSSLQAAIFSGLGTLEKLGISEQRRKLAPSSQPRSSTTVPAEVAALQSPSSKFPIAPDCLVPNSIVRKQVGYIPLPEDIPQQTHTAFTRERAHEVTSFQNGDKSIAGAVSTAGSLEDEDTLDVLREDLPFIDFLQNAESARGHEKEVAAPDAEEEEEEGKEEELEKTKRTGTLTEAMEEAPCTPLQQQQQQLSAGGRDVDAVEDPGPTSDPHKGRERRVVQLEPRHDSKSTAKPTAPAQTSSAGPMTEARTAHSKDTGQSSTHEDSYAQSTETKAIPTVTIPFGQGTNHRGHAQRHTSDLSHSGAQRRPSMTMTTQGGKVDEGVAGEGDSEATAVVRSIMQRQWFPHRLRHCSNEELCTGLVSLLAEVEMPIFGEVCQALLELKEVSLLTATQQLAVLDTLIAQLPSAEPSLKATIMNSLEQLGVGRDDVVLSLLPFLVDPNIEVKNAAFSALKGLSGVSNRSQLQQLLIRLGLLQHVETNEEEILQDLARRVGSGARAIARSGADSHPHSTSRPAGDHEMAEKSTLVDRTSAPNKTLCPRGGDGKRLQSVEKHKPSSKHGARVSGKTVITKAKLAAQNNAEVTECRQTISQEEEENNRAREQTGQSGRQEELEHNSPGTVNTEHRVVYSSAPNNTAAQRGALSLTPMVKAKHQAILPLIPGGQNTVSTVSNHRRQSNSGNQHVGSLHKLLAVNPTSFSQTRSAMNWMVRAYDERRKGTSVTSDQFIWSEVFPVLRPTEGRAGKTRRGRRGRAQSYPTTSDDTVTVLPKLVPCSGGVVQHSALTQAAPGRDNMHAVQTVCELKLPRIG